MVASRKFHASPDLLRFHESSFFIPGSIHHSLPMWSEILHDFPNRSTLHRYLEFGVDIKKFFIKFEGTFQGQVYSSPLPPHALFPNKRSCQAFSELISNNLYFGTGCQWIRVCLGDSGRSVTPSPGYLDHCRAI